jgi:hypothetical protein
VHIKSPTTQEVLLSVFRNGETPSITQSTETITLDETVSDQDIVITGECANAGDAIATRLVEIWKIG